MDRMRELVDYLNEKNYQYYTLDDPTISDVEYDRLYDELVKLEAESGERLPDSPTRRVGGEVRAGFEPHTHLARLWSMGKAQSIEALEDWARRAEKLRQDAVAAGADGLIIEVHNDPIHALCDGAQSLRPEEFAALAEKVRAIRGVL